ncbi:MAG TPA: alpha/beta hydrolase-fold protein [Gaiellaceae bacterium]
MSVTASSEGPSVSATEAVLSVPDPGRLLEAVALLHELERPRRVPFERNGHNWELRLPRPPVDRLEYLLELRARDGSDGIGPDAANPFRATGPFGDKSVLEFPGYDPPAWLQDDEAVPGELRPLPLDSRRLGTTLDALLWSAPETDPAEPLPLLLVHDGPEYARFSGLIRLLDHLADFGEIPECRAALLPPPRDRNESYSASARYANALAAELVPLVRAEAPTERELVLMGASLGAVAALHAHWRNPGLVGGLFLQSGSFFRRRFDSHESGFGRFGRISRFVGAVNGGRGIVAPVPTTITCGTAEENVHNNRTLAEALARRGFPVTVVEHPDAHNWISWRDALAPYLAELLLRAWT